MERQERLGNCIFCEIIGSETKDNKIAETDKAVAILSLEGHPIILTKKHVDDSNREFHKDDILAMFELANEIDTIVRSVYGVDAVNIIQNRGADAGQEISHYHVHVVPRQPGDKLVSFKRPNITGKDKHLLTEKLTEAFDETKR